MTDQSDRPTDKVTDSPGGAGPVQARTLRIRLNQRAEVCIDMSFAASLTTQLPRLLPVRVRARVERHRIDLPAIAALASRQGFPPGELFRSVEGRRTLRA